MRKICVVTANRSDWSRLETVLDAIKKHPKLELQLVVIGSHLLDKTGYTIEEIERKNFPIHHRLFMEVAGENPTTMAKSVGLAMIELSTVFDHLKPDIVLTHGDRYESLAVGSAAAIMNICVGHIQGGEVSGSIDESIRHALTKMAHLHFVSTEQSRERVIKMGEDPQTVFNVGCPGIDVLLNSVPKNKHDTVAELNEKLVKTGGLDTNRPYILVIQHPVTTEYETAGGQMLETAEALYERKEQLVMLWPNIDAGSDALSATLRRHDIVTREGVKILKHLSPPSFFANILRNAACIVGNSSSGIREACYFGTPAVNIGSRQHSRERGANVIDVPHDRMRIAEAIEEQIAHGPYPVEKIYGDGTAGAQLTEICASCKLPNIQKKIQY